MTGPRPIERGRVWVWPERLDLPNVPTEWLYVDLAFHASVRRQPHLMRRVWTFQRAPEHELRAEIERRREGRAA